MTVALIVSQDGPPKIEKMFSISVNWFDCNNEEMLLPANTLSADADCVCPRRRRFYHNQMFSYANGVDGAGSRYQVGCGIRRSGNGFCSFRN